MLLHVWLLALYNADGPAINLLRCHTITNLLDDSVVDESKKLIVALLRLVGVDEVGSGDGRTVRLVPKPHGGNDDVRVKVFVVGFTGKSKIVLATALDRRSQNPVQLSGIEVRGKFALARQLDCLPELVVVELLIDLVGECGVFDFLFGIEDVGHFVKEVGGHQGNTSLGGGSHGSEFALVLYGKGVGRKGGGNVDLGHILALIVEELLPLIDEGSSGGVFGNGADLVLKCIC